MKLYLYQQPYAYDYKEADASIEAAITALEQLPADADIALFPEYTNSPSAFPKGTAIPLAQKYNQRLISATVAAAQRCKAIIVMSYAAEIAPGVWRNTTEVFDRNGNSAGRYFKQHLVRSEVSDKGMDSSYVNTTHWPAIVETEGIRIGFLTCYDSYFPEFICNIAAQRPDLVCICSHQRAERPDVLETEVRFTAFQCNAYVMRASVSMGEKADRGGHSMVAAPDGSILAKFNQETGFLSCEIEDIHQKYMRSNSFGGEMISNTRFLEQGRTPWAYRPAGCTVVPDDAHTPYPRICAHRGFNTIAPESSMAALGAAIALGAQEIEFDIRLTKDGRLVVSHDPNLERVTGHPGHVEEMTYDELRKIDFGAKSGERFQGLKILTLEDVLERFQQQVIINLHIKPDGDADFNRRLIQDVASILRRYEMERHTYFMISTDGLLEAARKYAPDICRCQGAGKDHWGIVDNAIRNQCQKAQLFLPYVNQEMIDKAREHGIICNLFYVDKPEEALEWHAKGIDTILTNDYQNVANAFRQKGLIR